MQKKNNKALVVVGMAEGHWCKREIPRTISHVRVVNTLIKLARKHRWPVIFAAGRVKKWHEKYEEWPLGARIPKKLKDSCSTDVDMSKIPAPPAIHCLCAELGEPGCTPGEANTVNFNPELDIQKHDYAVGFLWELIAAVKALDIQELYYCGSHLGECVASEEFGMRNMVQLMPVFFFPEETLAFTKDPMPVVYFVDKHIAPMVYAEEVFE